MYSISPRRYLLLLSRFQYLSKAGIMLGFIRKTCWLLPFLLFCGKWERDNPVDPKGTQWNPPIVTAMRDTMVNINDSITITATVTDSSEIERFLWIRTGAVYVDTTTTGSLKTAWPDSGRKTVLVKAINNNGVHSKADTCIVRVTLDPPMVTAMSDTTIGINDSLTISSSAMDNGAIIKYLWAKNGTSYSDTTITGTFKTSWTDSGHMIMSMKAIDDDNVASRPDTCIVLVLLNPPTVTVVHDTTVNINDSLTIIATGKDNQEVVNYTWAKDGIHYLDTTKTCSVSVAFSDSGRKVVRVKTIDDDGVWSAPDSCMIIVRLDEPVVTTMGDTTVNINDSLAITATASDNGKVMKYIWARNGSTFVDTTIAALLKVAFADSGRENVIIRAIDDDGLVSRPDTCVVRVTLDPPMVTAMLDTSVNIKDSMIITASATDNGTVLKYAWTYNGSTFSDMTTAGSIKVVYSDSGRKVVYVKALDDDSVWSATDSCVLTVTLGVPSVTVMRDTSINIRDSLTITAIGKDNGDIVKYYWGRNGRVLSDTTTAGWLKVAYSDSGRKNVIVQAEDDDSLISRPDTCIVLVTLDPPIVTVMQDTTANIKDSVTITATGSDNGSVAKYLWARNGITFVDTTMLGALKVAFPDSGRKVVRVKAMDDDGILSAPDSCIVKVTLDPPLVTAHRDTTVSFNATTTVTVFVEAVDSNASGSIVKYYWDIGANGWDDSTNNSSYLVSTSTGGPVMVRWAARDDDGVMTADTFIAIFNRAPSPPVVTAPTATTAWKSFNTQIGKGTLPFVFSATDPDGADDTLRYTLYTGPSVGTLAQQFSGEATNCNLNDIGSMTMIYWRLLVHDQFGDSIQTSGTFVAPHSPPLGMKRILSGTFQMGGQSGNTDPIHQVTISYDYYIDSTEVTQADYLALGPDPTVNTSLPNNPVEELSWYMAALYCNKRSLRDGYDTVYSYLSISGTARVLIGLTIDLTKNGYRLPTEAEWEYACRAGTTTEFFWGDAADDNTVMLYAWMCHNSGNNTAAHPVATKLSNGWGIYDLAGNVWEWCNDWYGDYSTGKYIDPIGPMDGVARVLRGGSHYDGCEYPGSNGYFSSAFRFFDSANSHQRTGVRCVLPIK
jgi:formylglycine-generating enzyme required for sulfatase activity